jgi:hypothetical protein
MRKEHWMLTQAIHDSSSNQCISVSVEQELVLWSKLEKCNITGRMNGNALTRL